MENIVNLIQELKEKGDPRWEELQLMASMSGRIELQTPFGKLRVFSNPHDNEIWVDVKTEAGDEMSIAHISVDEDEEGVSDVVSRLWIGSQEDYAYRNKHEVLQQIERLELED